MQQQNVKPSAGKDKWSKRAIDEMLRNEKYTGNVILQKKSLHSERFLSKKNHPAIISEETFKAVQIEKGRKSNIVVGEDGVKKKNTKYSATTRKSYI